MSETTYTRIFARKSGNNALEYRWLAEVGSGRLVRAQEHPAVTTTPDDIDTWSDDVDARVSRRTPIRVPAGMLVLVSFYDRAGQGVKHSHYGAALVSTDPKEPLDWTAAKHVAVRYEDADPQNKRAGKIAIHRIDVGGVVAEYRCDA